MSTLFEKIIAREIPSYRLYEDDLCYAFLDIYPVQPGHTLLIPKIPVSDFLDLDDATFVHLFHVAKNIIAPALKKSFSPQRVGLMVEGFGVPDHVHIHLTPLHAAGDFHRIGEASFSPEQMEEIREKIVNNIAQ